MIRFLLTVILLVVSINHYAKTNDSLRILKLESEIVQIISEREKAKFIDSLTLIAHEQKIENLSKESNNNSEKYKDILIFLSPFLVLIWTSFKENKFNKERRLQEKKMLDLSNKHTLEMTQLKHKNEEELTQLKSELEFKKFQEETEIKNINNDLSNRKECTTNIHSSLTKMLFKVQRLYLNLSSKCSDQSCLLEETNTFEKGFLECMNETSKYMTFLEPEITNTVYSFFQHLGKLINELKSINEAKEEMFDIAHPSVYVYSKVLARIVANIQKTIAESSPEANEEIHLDELENMIHCCGTEPEGEIMDKYYDEFPESLEYYP